MGTHTCGTHFGATNEPASIVCKPVFANRLTSSIFVSAGILLFSFCKPSLGPTSIIRTWSARARLELVKVRLERCLYARRPRKIGDRKDIVRSRDVGYNNTHRRLELTWTRCVLLGRIVPWYASPSTSCACDVRRVQLRRSSPISAGVEMETLCRHPPPSPSVPWHVT